MRNKMLKLCLLTGVLFSTMTVNSVTADATEINLEQEIIDSTSGDFEEEKNTQPVESTDEVKAEVESNSTESAESKEQENITTKDTVPEDTSSTNTDTTKKFPKTGDFSLWDIVIDFLQSLVGGWFR